MTEWLSREKEKEKQKEISTGEEAGGGLHFSEFLGSFFFRQLLAWESNYMAAAAEDRGVFFSLF